MAEGEAMSDPATEHKTIMDRIVNLESHLLQWQAIFNADHDQSIRLLRLLEGHLEWHQQQIENRKRIHLV